MTLGIALATKASFAGPMPRGYCQSHGSRGLPRTRDKWAATVSPGKENLGRYKIYIFKVPEQVHPGVGVDAKVMSIMNSFIKDIFEKLAGSVPAIYRSLPRGANCIAPGKPHPGDGYAISNVFSRPGEEMSHPKLHVAAAVRWSGASPVDGTGMQRHLEEVAAK